MNVATNKPPIAELKGFRGLWSRGAYDTCPQDHLTDCMNCVFPAKDQLTIRESITTSSVIGGRTIISFFIATVSGGACLLTLNSDGTFYNETVGPTLLGTFIGADDFAALNMFGRTYICFKALGKPLAASVLYYFNGTALIAAGGTAPGAGLALAQANPGNVDSGVHGVAISFVSPTGFVTPPSAVVNITSTGANDIELSGMPNAPSASWSKLIMMTKANQTELFFVPGGTAAWNAATATINVYDTSLVSSADYLSDLLTSIPAGSALRFFRGRLILIGQLTTPDICLVSRVDDPESFDQVNGTITFPVDYGINTCNSGMVIRDVLYVTKPNGTFATQDNGGQPGTWAVSIVDSGIGAWDTGISLFSSSMSGSDALDTSFIVNKRGLMLFNGSYQDVALTYKIESLWQLILPNYLYKVQIAHDVWLKRVYLAVPLVPPVYNAGFVDTATTGKTVIQTNAVQRPFFPGMVGMTIVINGVEYKVATYVSTVKVTVTTDPGNQSGVGWSIKYPGVSWQTGGSTMHTILMMDYTDGLDPMSVKWSTWDSDIFRPTFTGGITKMSVENFTLSGTIPIYQLAFCVGGTTIYKVLQQGSKLTQTVTIPTTGDAITGILNVPINQYIVTTPVAALQPGVYTFTMISFNLYGNGIMYPQTLSANRVSQVPVRTFNLSSYITGIELERLINVVSESMQVLLQCDQNQPSGNNGFIQLIEMDLWANKTWNMRPALTETA